MFSSISRFAKKDHEMLFLNPEQMSPEALRDYNEYLIRILNDPMSREEYQAYRQHREAVATLRAFPRLPD